MAETTPPPPPPSTAPPSTPPPPAVPAKKGGMPGWAWLLIGCGGLLLLIFLALGAGCWWLGGKAKEFADNPEVATVKMIAAANPDIEFVEADSDEGTATLRNVKTGEVIEVDFQDIKEGNFRWTVDGKESSYEVDEETGNVTFRSETDEGVQTAEFGRGETPAWIPVYPGSAYQGGFRSASGDRATGTATYTTDDSVADVIGHFEEWMEDEGMEVSTTDISSGGHTIRSVRGEGDGRSLTVTAQKGSNEEQVQIGVVFEGPK